MQPDHEIPDELRPAADAALAWLNQSNDRQFELTGIVGADAALASPDGDGFDLGLIVCDGELCAREDVRVHPAAGRYEFEAIDAQDTLIPPLLDPPVGLRRAWLDGQMEKFEFVLLLFYRGRW
jgi:hypothetical protein